MQINIASIHFDADQKLLDFIEKKVQKLGNYFDRITRAEVALKLENAGQVKDKIVELRINVPGEMLIAKESNKSFESATDQAVDNMKRQVIKYKGKFKPKSFRLE